MDVYDAIFRRGFAESGLNGDGTAPITDLSSLAAALEGINDNYGCIILGRNRM